MTVRFLAAAALALAATTAATATSAGAQATPGTARAARDRAQAAANAASARNRATDPAAATATPATNAAAPAQGGARARRGQPAAVPDSADVSRRGAMGQLTFRREAFAYDAAGRRDPFVSLMASGELRPIISDLQLKSIIYDATGRNSVAVLRDAQTKDQYRVRVGQTLGRMRVTAIRPREVVFTIDEFGFNRQEVLTYSDPAPRKP